MRTTIALRIERSATLGAWSISADGVMSADDSRFYECANPPRVVRVRKGEVERLTPAGWRRAPWLNPCKPRLAAQQIDSVLQLQRQSLQRVNSTETYAAPVQGTSRTCTWAERPVEWLLPPLPYGAPWYFSASDHEAAIVAYCRDHRPPGFESQELLDQAREGYERQESRVAEIENRASGYDGYAAAAAALAALGATLLGGDKTKAFGDVGQPLLIALLVAATG